MNEMNESAKINLDEVKERISQMSQNPLDSHSQEFEKIHADLARALSEIDGL